jgi:glucosamine--fructose-6-phosphate aminotransferase (isomerizing)
MCGIVGYVGHRRACDVVVQALHRMEYRGYDSAGIAILDGNGGMTVERRAGRLANLGEALDCSDPVSLQGHSGLGHTRWATHGRPTDRNAHPHRDATGKIAVVHNGIIENYAELREELSSNGHILRSETDTETIAHLIESYYQGDLVAAVARTIRD